jgi:hypothetical protein
MKGDRMKEYLREFRMGVYTAKLYLDRFDGEYTSCFYKRSRYLADPAAFHTMDYNELVIHADMCLSRLHAREMESC